MLSKRENGYEVRTCWTTNQRCPQCEAVVNTNGVLIWCAIAGCDYGMKEDISAEQYLLDLEKKDTEWIKKISSDEIDKASHGR